jgi:hypothetical protein
MDDEDDQQGEVAFDEEMLGHWPLVMTQKPNISERVTKKPKPRLLPVLAGDKRRAEEGQTTGPVLKKAKIKEVPVGAGDKRKPGTPAAPDLDVPPALKKAKIYN